MWKQRFSKNELTLKVSTRVRKMEMAMYMISIICHMNYNVRKRAGNGSKIWRMCHQWFDSVILLDYIFYCRETNLITFQVALESHAHYIVCWLDHIVSRKTQYLNFTTPVSKMIFSFRHVKHTLRYMMNLSSALGQNTDVKCICDSIWPHACDWNEYLKMQFYVRGKYDAPNRNVRQWVMSFRIFMLIFLSQTLYQCECVWYKLNNEVNWKWMGPLPKSKPFATSHRVFGRDIRADWQTDVYGDNKHSARLSHNFEIIR